MPQIEWNKIAWLESAAYLQPWWRTVASPPPTPPATTPPATLPPPPPPPTTAPPTPTTAWAQAEDAALQGVAVASSTPGYQGSGYVDAATFDAAGDSITFSFVPGATGAQTLVLRYSIPAGWGDKTNGVRVNGGPVVATKFANTAGAWGQQAVPATLVAGTNTLALSKDWGWMSVDALGYPVAPAPPPTTPPPTADDADTASLPAHG